MAFKASGYVGKKGGIFTVCTDEVKVRPEAFFYGPQYIDPHKFRPIKKFDSSVDNSFFEAHTYLPEEMHLTFNPENYNERVKGVLTEEARIYMRKNINKLYHQFCGPTGNKGEPKKFVLAAERFRTQEVLFHAFQHLNVIDMNTLKDHWQSYHEAGVEIVKQKKAG